MANAADSKSADLTVLRVRVPPPVPSKDRCGSPCQRGSARPVEGRAPEGGRQVDLPLGGCSRLGANLRWLGVPFRLPILQAGNPRLGLVSEGLGQSLRGSLTVKTRVDKDHDRTEREVRELAMYRFGQRFR
jgi:hypothetical protein